MKYFEFDYNNLNVDSPDSDCYLEDYSDIDDTEISFHTVSLGSF